MLTIIAVATKGNERSCFFNNRFSIPGQYNTKVHCAKIILIWPNEIFLSVLPFKNKHLLGQKFKYASLTRLVPSIYYFFRLFVIFYYLIDLFCGQRQSQFLAVLIKKTWSLKKNLQICSCGKKRLNPSGQDILELLSNKICGKSLYIKNPWL